MHFYSLVSYFKSEQKTSVFPKKLKLYTQELSFSNLKFIRETLTVK